MLKDINFGARNKALIALIHCYPQAFFGFVFKFGGFLVRADVCVGKTYSFAILGGVLALSELQMCMALCVGVVRINFYEVALFLFAVAIFLFAVVIILMEVVIFLMEVTIFLLEVAIFLLEVRIFLFDVTIIPIAVDNFLTAIGIFLKVVAIFLIEVCLTLYFLESYSFYLSKFWTCGAKN